MGAIEMDGSYKNKKNIVVEGDVTAVRIAPVSPWLEAWRMFVRNRAALVGLGMLTLIVAAALLGPLLYPVDPFGLAGAPMTPPATDAMLPLGSDSLGRDILAGLLHGARATLTVGGIAAAITMTLGLAIGSVAGFYGGRVERLLMRVTEFFQVLPPLLFAMVIVSLFSPTLIIIAIAIGVTTWTNVARLSRGEFLRLKQFDYVKASRAAGASNGRLLWRLILPNAMPPLLIAGTLAVGLAILFESALSFLGLSDPNVMSWGVMIGSNKDAIFHAWWAVTFPGLAIFFTVLSISLIGDGLNEALNPKLRGR